MPTLADLRKHFTPQTNPHTSLREETTYFEEDLITDARGGLTPAQVVELKLRSALHGRAPSPVELVSADGRRVASK